MIKGILILNSIGKVRLQRVYDESVWANTLYILVRALATWKLWLLNWTRRLVCGKNNTATS